MERVLSIWLDGIVLTAVFFQFSRIVSTAGMRTGTVLFNEGGYSNTRLDSIIEATNLTMDPVERLLLYETAQEIGMNDLPWIPLHIEYNLYGLSEDVSYTPSINKLITLRTIFPK